MYNEDAKLTKFSIIVEDINKKIKDKYDVDENDSGLWSTLRNEQLGEITPLNLIFKNKSSNNFIKIIFEQVKMPINDGKWNSKYTIEDLDDNNKKIVATKEFIEYYRRKKGKYGFIFWTVFTAMVEKENFQQNILLMADFAYLLKVDEKALNDIINYVKFAFGAYEDESIKVQNHNTNCLWSLLDVFKESVYYLHDGVGGTEIEWED